MESNKFSVAADVFKRFKRWAYVSQQSRKAHAITKKVWPSFWDSRPSAVSVHFEKAPKLQTDRTHELKRAAAQLTRSNDTLRSHYQMAVNSCLTPKKEEQPDTLKKLTDLMASNISMEQTKGKFRMDSTAKYAVKFKKPSTFAIDFKPQNSIKINRVLNKFKTSENVRRPQVPKLKTDAKDIPEADVRRCRNAKAVDNVKKIEVLEKARDPFQRDKTNDADQNHWKIGSMCIPRLNV